MELRNFLDKADAPVLIDQEGGGFCGWTAALAPVYPPGAAFGDPALGSEAARLGSRLIAAVVGGFISAFEFERKHANHTAPLCSTVIAASNCSSS